MASPLPYVSVPLRGEVISNVVNSGFTKLLKGRVSVPLRGEVISNCIARLCFAAKETIAFPSPYGVRSFQTISNEDVVFTDVVAGFPSPYGVRSFQTWYF